MKSASLFPKSRAHSSLEVKLPEGITNESYITASGSRNFLNIYENTNCSWATAAVR
jgi:hypothetical protein